MADTSSVQAVASRLPLAGSRLEDVQRRLADAGQRRAVPLTGKTAGRDTAPPAKDKTRPAPTATTPLPKPAGIPELRRGTIAGRPVGATPLADGPKSLQKHEALADAARRLRSDGHATAWHGPSMPPGLRRNVSRPAGFGYDATIRVRNPQPGERASGKDMSEHSARQRFADQYRADQLRHLTAGPVARNLNLAEQYRMYQQGDVTRRLGLHGHVAGATGVVHATYLDRLHGAQRIDDWRRHRGPISPAYTASCFRYHYYGPGYFALDCWYPRWTGWVDWSWRFHCDPWWDPRPLWCRPVVYAPCLPWVWWECPVWTPLPVVPSGTWVEVEPVVVEPQRFDLQLLAVRFVDPGHPDEKLGPRYRVWFRNNSQEPIDRPFDVLLIAADDERLPADSPRAGVRVTGIGAGSTQSVDVRLPFEVYQVGRNQQGGPAPLGMLHVLIDANREVPEAFEANNGTRIAQADVLPVDPAAFELKPHQAPAGGEVLVAGEGFGPEPGRVLIHLGGLELDAQILGWYDLGVRLALPPLPLAGPTEAELIVVRGDGAAANPLKLTVTPPQAEPLALPAALPREQ